MYALVSKEYIFLVQHGIALHILKFLKRHGFTIKTVKTVNASIIGNIC